MKRTLIIAAAVCLCSSLSLQAAVSPEVAAKLGNELTPMGAETAANADGSIPAWTGGGIDKENPAGFDPANAAYPDPYADESPLYTITQENMGQYADVLSEGQQAMLEKFGSEGYVLNVYPSHRTFAAPDWFYEGTKANATGATLEDDGQRIANNVAGVPFPVPQQALEVLWNHMIRWMGYQMYHTAEAYNTDPKGNIVLSSGYQEYWEFPMFMAHKNPDRGYPSDELSWAYLRTNFEAPPRRAGEILVVHEPGADYTAGKGRDAWQYLVGQRRVRKAPAVSFDTPRPANAGMVTYDDAYAYNGSPERFDWKLVGKKEMIVLYNNYTYSLGTPQLDSMGPHFVKPDMLRYEKHRVWVVEGTLKDGARHVYGKRRYLIDEDSWFAIETMRWDRQDKLWRVGFHPMVNLWDVQIPYGLPEINYDLVANICSTSEKGVPGTLKLELPNDLNFWSPQGMARSGVR